MLGSWSLFWGLTRPCHYLPCHRRRICGVAGGQARDNGAESTSSSAGGWAGGPALSGDFSWWGVSPPGDGPKWGEPAGFRVSLSSLHHDLWKRSLMLPLLVRRQCQCSHKVHPPGSIISVLGMVDFVKCSYPSCRFEHQGKKRSVMVDHAMLSRLPWHIWGDVTCLQCHVMFVCARQLEWLLQDAHGSRPEEHVWEYMDLIEDLLLFLARYLSSRNPTLEGLLLRAQWLQRFGAIPIPLNCSLNPLWIWFLERFGLPVPEVFSMVSLNSIACLLHWRVLLALSTCLPGKLKAEFQVLSGWEGKPGVRQASMSVQSRGKARPTRQVLGDC